MSEMTTYPNNDQAMARKTGVRPSTAAELLAQAAAHELAGRHDLAVELLRINRHPSLTAWARSVVDPTLRWIITAGSRDYDRSQFQDSPSLYSVARKIYLWTETDEYPSPLHHDLDRAFRTFTNTLSEME